MKTLKRNIIIFICVTLLSGWFGVLFDSVLTEQPEGNSLGMGIWLISPSLTALILRLVSRDKKGLGIKPNFKGNLKWYALSAGYYPLVMIVCVLMAKLSGCLDSSTLTINGFITLAVASMAAGFIKNIFEEFSWRGYLTPKLIQIKLSDWWIYIISGAVWGLWHAAYYLVFLPDTYFESISRPGMILTGCLLMMVWSVMYVEIYRLTRSVWPCVIMHSAEDAVPTALVTVSSCVTFTGKGDLWFNPTTGIIATVLFLGIGLLLRKIRIQRTSHAGDLP
ncbi:MAG: CPBP family intramembrane metalloprotease [Oscillospiraceae bacterium]|nr:CPBP family intramembrane metalloprotease [Oscillospiraceae bacterium]